MYLILRTDCDAMLRSCILCNAWPFILFSFNWKLNEQLICYIKLRIVFSLIYHAYDHSISFIPFTWHHYNYYILYQFGQFYHFSRCEYVYVYLGQSLNGLSKRSANGCRPVYKKKYTYIYMYVDIHVYIYIYYTYIFCPKH